MAFLLRFLCCPCFSVCVCVVRHPGEWVFARLTSVSGLWRVDSEALSRARTPVEVCLGSGVVCFFLFESESRYFFFLIGVFDCTFLLFFFYCLSFACLSFFLFVAFCKYFCLSFSLTVSFFLFV